jgi:hypothetical protein
VLHLKLGQGKLAKGNAGDSAKSVHNDRDRKQQKISEQSIRLVVLRLPRGHEFSKTPEFSAEWMVNKEKQGVQKLSGAVQTLVQTVQSSPYKAGFLIRMTTFRTVQRCFCTLKSNGSRLSFSEIPLTGAAPNYCQV